MLLVYYEPAARAFNYTIQSGPRSEGGFGLAVELEVDLPGLGAEEAKTLVEKAHEICPYSNATRNNVEVKLSLKK